MYANGFFEEKRRSPAGFAAVVGVHVALLGALALYGTTQFVREPGNNIDVINIPLQPDPPPIPPPPEETETMTDWELIHFILSDYYLWAGLQHEFNGDSAINKSWVDELRAGRYHGRPRTGERPWGSGDDTGVWQEFDLGTAIWSPARGASWTG